MEYNKLKYILSGLKTRDDAIAIISKLTLSHQIYNLAMSYINGKKYDVAFDNNTMIKYIRELSLCKYKDDVHESMQGFINNTADVAQIKTFFRIANSKPSRPQYTKDMKHKNDIQNVTKKCPHCGHKCIAPKGTKYVICGYYDTGYDWDGCGADWCFKCNKLLCKKWDNDKLYIPINRVHDNKCCKKHAKINNKDYQNEYCMCKNLNVMRDCDTHNMI